MLAVPREKQDEADFASFIGQNLAQLIGRLFPPDRLNEETEIISRMATVKLPQENHDALREPNYRATA
jgi:hypothetical protein